jgi:hypothetical protein
MRSCLACITAVAALVLSHAPVSIPHRSDSVEASRLSDGVDLIVVCGDEDHNAHEDRRVALVIRNCWLLTTLLT